MEIVLALLLEGMTLVSENAILEAKHPDGLYGFIANSDNGSFCSDGTISKTSFFEVDDGLGVLLALPSMGLELGDKYAADVAAFMHGGGLRSPCIWLESKANSNGYTVCYHYAEEIGEVIAVPKHFKKQSTLSEFQDLNGDEITERVSRVGNNYGVALFQDNQSKNMIYGPKQLCRH